MVSVAPLYRGFLEDVLATASRRGPHDAAVVRHLELGTEHLLLGPARAAEASGMSRAELQAARKELHAELRPIWEKGLFGYEITHWPSGPGSARAMELVYLNRPLPYDVSSHYSEWFLLTRDLAHAVRSRRDVLRELMIGELNGKSGAVSVLDLACGPCQSLREALPFLHDPARIALRAVDTDELAQINNRGFFQRDHGLAFHFEVANVFKTDLGVDQHDLVYSTGLYDYIESRTLAKLWKTVYASLKPGGLAILSVKDGGHFCPLFYRWAIEWSQFHIRVEPEFRDIMQRAELPAPESVVRDNTGCIVFYMIRKPA